MYTFKLQAVLDHRQFSEDNLKKELADIRQQVMTAQERLEMLKEKEKATTAALKVEQADGLSSDGVVGYHNYLKRLSDRIARQKRLISDLEALKSVKQSELGEAMRKRQILEKLKDQGLDRYNQEMLKKEINFIDEIAVNQFVRKTMVKDGADQ